VGITVIIHRRPVKRVVDSGDSTLSYTRLIPSFLTKSEESVTYESIAQQWNGDKDDWHHSAQHASLSRSLAACSSLSRPTVKRESGSGKRIYNGKTETRPSLMFRTVTPRLSAATGSLRHLHVGQCGSDCGRTGVPRVCR